jgi:hypothetical protein
MHHGNACNLPTCVYCCNPVHAVDRDKAKYQHRLWSTACANHLLNDSTGWLSFISLKEAGLKNPSHPDFKYPGSDMVIWLNCFNLPSRLKTILKEAHTQNRIEHAQDTP